MNRQDELRKILDLLWEKAFSGGSRQQRKGVDINQALSAIHALDTDQNILCKECEHRKAALIRVRKQEDI